MSSDLRLASLLLALLMAAPAHGKDLLVEAAAQNAERFTVAQVAAKERNKLESYLKKTFNNPALRVRTTKQKDVMELYLGTGSVAGRIERNEDDEDYFVQIPVAASDAKDKTAMESYAKKLLNNPAAELKPTQDSGKFELYVGPEFLGLARLEGAQSAIELYVLDGDLDP